MKKQGIWLFILICALFQCRSEKEINNKSGGELTMVIYSSAFKENEMIPPKYTCDGENISPPLSWSGASQNTKSFALVVDDPDAPMGIWVHWVVYNIPASVTSFDENIPPIENLENGALQGMNDFHKKGYGGPCPPSGIHRYFFKIYALDKIISLSSGATKTQLEKAMDGHIIAKGELIGKYSRSR